MASVEWAPVNIPLERRLQTAAVIVGLSLFPAYFALLGFLTASNFGRAFLLLYCVWWWWDRDTPVQGGRPWSWVRDWWLWRYARSYYPAEMLVTTPFRRDKPHVIAVHPHGIIGLGVIGNMAHITPERSAQMGELDFRILTVGINFVLPLWRELILWLGFVDASRDSAAYLLRSGKSVVVVVGGASEALYARPGRAELVLRRRKGFVRLALRTGASLVPAYTFGENEAWDQMPNPEGSWVRCCQRTSQKLLGFSTPFFYGRGIFQYSFGLLPYRRPLLTVLGAPIECEQCDHPTEAQVDALLDRYIAALVRLYNDHVDEYARRLEAAGEAAQGRGWTSLPDDDPDADADGTAFVDADIDIAEERDAQSSAATTVLTTGSHPLPSPSPSRARSRSPSSTSPRHRAPRIRIVE
jgi:2-acylglycerol O-acyltransferase 2